MHGFQGGWHKEICGFGSFSNCTRYWYSSEDEWYMGAKCRARSLVNIGIKYNDQLWIKEFLLKEAEELTSLSIFSHSHIEARMRVKIVVDDVIGALGGLCPHRRRCTCAFEGEPR